jgi:hypothetical protein
MKHIFYVASIVLPLVCGANIAMAFIGVPPLSGPGSVFYGNPGADPTAPLQKSKPKQKSQEPPRIHRRISRDNRQGR